MSEELNHISIADGADGWARVEALRERYAHSSRPCPVASWFTKRIGLSHMGVARAAVICLGIERFEMISGSLGSDAARRLLEEIKRRLSETPELTNVVVGPAYFEIGMAGGDRLTVFIAGVQGERETRAIASFMWNKVTEPYFLMGHTVHLTASVGIAVSGDGIQREDLFRDADAALFSARMNERGRVAMFEPKMRAATISRIEMERDLRAGMKRGEFWVAYQPILTMGSGEVDGFEALLRWDHPLRGGIPPAEFVPIAEETGLIEELGQFVMDEACRELARLDEEFGCERFTMSVNVSKRQLLEQRLVSATEGALAATGVDAHRLHLEVTESIVMDHAEHVAPMLTQLRELGTRIAMDDFGVGHSSLSCLQQFPLDYLKIDRAFITEMANNRRHSAVVHAVIALARDLGMKVVAEGVETIEQVAALKAMACDLAQGFLFSHPLTPSQLRAFLQSRASIKQRVEVA